MSLSSTEARTVFALAFVSLLALGCGSGSKQSDGETGPGAGGGSGAAGQGGRGGEAGAPTAGHAGTGDGGAAGATGAVGGLSGAAGAAGGAGGRAAGGGTACGKVTCGIGQVCCNASCGVCTLPGGACPTIVCADLTFTYSCGSEMCVPNATDAGQPSSTAPPCTAEQTISAPCSSLGFSCDPNDGCPHLLVCNDGPLACPVH